MAITLLDVFDVPGGKVFFFLPPRSWLVLRVEIGKLYNEQHSGVAVARRILERATTEWIIQFGNVLYKTVAKMKQRKHSEMLRSIKENIRVLPILVFCLRAHKTGKMSYAVNGLNSGTTDCVCAVVFFFLAYACLDHISTSKR